MGHQMRKSPTTKAAKLDRDATLNAVMRCFWTHGYEATSLGRLEKATGLGRQSLYNAFGGKEALFAATLDRYRDEVGGPLMALVDRDEPIAAIRAFLEGHLEMLADGNTPPGCLISSCSNELGPRQDTLGARMRDETAAGTQALRSVFTRWKADGKLSATADPQALAALLAAISRGLAVLGRASPDPSLVAQAVDGAMQAFAPFIMSDPDTA